ncbi:MAG: AAA family ATPase, partial [Paracoccaceae bacterium]
MGDFNQISEQLKSHRAEYPREAFVADGAKRASRFFRASDLADKPVPDRQWLVHDLVPDGTVTLLGGDGGTGKSL